MRKVETSNAEQIPVKNGDIIVIPPRVFRWIDNTRSSKPFVLFTSVA